ncbi:MAG: stage III sporulation protein AD [Lachnospiraceae bacterium]|nr:stage III sporulation protein AD [Lachnospiraceae bacterium]
MAIIIKIGVLGVAGVLLALQFKAQKPEYSILVGVGICLLIFGFVAGQLGLLLEKFELLKEYLDQSGEYLAVLFKVIGITYICEFSAAICKDAGYGAVAGQIEILGKLSVILAGLPVLFAVIGQIQSLS